MNHLLSTIRRLISDSQYNDEQIKTMYWLLFDDSVNDSERANILDLIGKHRPELAKNIARAILNAVTA